MGINNYKYDATSNKIVKNKDRNKTSEILIMNPLITSYARENDISGENAQKEFLKQKSKQIAK